MSLATRQTDRRSPTVEFHLLGSVDYDDCLSLQQRLAYESGGRNDGRIDVLLCEHPSLITVGRSGSRGHIRLHDEELKRRQLEVRWISRGGGCVLHGPGQLAVYPIVPLQQRGWTVGQYMRRLQTAIVAALEEVSIRGQASGDSHGVWGRSGQLVAFGTAVRNGITQHGAFLNVNPAGGAMGYVDVARSADSTHAKTTMGSLLAERRQGVKMTSVRAALVTALATQFGSEIYHLHTGHPLLRRMKTIRT